MTVRYDGTVRYGTVRDGTVRDGTVRDGTGRYGAWRGVAWRGVAWRGVAWRGVAWRGVASRRVASRRVASRRVASRRVASRRVASRRVASRGDGMGRSCRFAVCLRGQSIEICVHLARHCSLQFRYLGYHIHCMSPVSFGIMYRRLTTSRGLCNVERKTCIGLHP